MALKPRRGTVVATVETKKLDSGIILPDESASAKKIIVQSVADDIEDLKKGDEILIRMENNISQAEIDGEDVLIIDDGDIIGIIG